MTDSFIPPLRMKRISFFIFVGVSCLVLTARALRFGHDPIKLDKSIITVGKPAKLTCDYVRFRTESIRQITWSFEYNGVVGKFFDYQVSTGEKIGSDYGFIEVEDDNTATEKEVEVVLDDYRAPEIKIYCEVHALRDNGYGKLRYSRKKAESLFKVADVSSWELSVFPHPEHKKRIEEHDRQISFKCLSKGARPPPTLSFSVKGQNLSEYEDVANVRSIYESEDESLIQVDLRELPSLFFEEGGKVLIVKCFAHYGEDMLGKEQVEMSRTVSSKNQNEDEIPRRQGKGTFDDQDSFNEIGDHFLNMMDPARHVHPGIPYDFFNGYVIMIADNLLDEEDVHTPHTTLLGEIPSGVKDSLKERLYGRVNSKSPVKIVLKVHPADVLNILGEMGYRVTSSTASHHHASNKLIWTLERRNFDKILTGKREL